MTKLLYIEDNEDNVYMLKMRLELLGDFEVLSAEDGEKGCQMAVAEQPEVILMDLEMPVLDGWEAARRLKSEATTRDIPIVALSAHALEDTTGGRTATDGTGLAVVAVRTVGGAHTLEAVTLHDTGVALALADACHVDLLAWLQNVDL